MSKFALRTFAEKILIDKSICPIINDEVASEDFNVPRCLGKLNIFAGDSRDWVNRGRFHMHFPVKLLFPQYNTTYFKMKYYWHDEGLNCCSNYSISFHYIYDRPMYEMYYLTYHLKPYGFQYKHPPLPKKANLVKIIKNLEMERLDRSLRGYH